MSRDEGTEHLMRSVAKHPVLYALAFGVAIGSTGLIGRAPLWMCVLFGVIMCVLVLVLYLPGGPMRRYVDRLPPED